MSAPGIPGRWRAPRPLHYATYAAYRAGLGVLGLLPAGALFALGRRLGAVASRLDARRRRVAGRNVRQALPGASGAEVARLVRRSFEYIGESAAESFCLARLARMRPEEVRERIVLEGAEKLEPARAGGRGGLFVGAHLGSFDLLGAAMGLFGFPFHTVSRPLGNPLVARHVARAREAWGQFLVPKRGALRYLLPALRRGGYAAFLLDQNERKRPLFLPVFGRPAACDRSVAALAVRLRLPVFLGYALRVGPGLRYRIVVEEAVLPGEEADEVALARRVQGVLERMILRHPDQYFWLHDRYRTRPPAERGAPSAILEGAGATAAGGGAR